MSDSKKNEVIIPLMIHEDLYKEEVVFIGDVKKITQKNVGS